jgi:hypothetical protein
MSSADRHTTTSAPALGRLALGSGLAMGVLLGLAEVAWAYRLVDLFPGRTWYLPVDSFFTFVGFAIAVDTVLVLIGALGVAAFAALLVRLLPNRQGPPALRLLVRVVVVGGSAGFLYLYWWRSPYPPRRRCRNRSRHRHAHRGHRDAGCGRYCR